MGQRKLHVLIIGSIGTASYQIGIHQPFQRLKEDEVCSFESRSEDQITDESIEKADIVIFFRTIRPKTYQCLCSAQKKGIKTVYVIDDQFLAMPYKTPLEKHYKEPITRQSITWFLKHADIVKVDAPFFANHLRTHFDPNAVVCFPASVDFELLDKLKKPERHDGKIVIGYEGGEKNEAFAPVVPALNKIMEQYKGKVNLEFIGHQPPEFKGHKSVNYVKGEPDYRSFLQKFYQCTWDIGIAPLEETLFHHCKTDNKFREYSACWIPGIYSASPPYSDSVTHEETGLLAPQSERGWYSAIKQMIENTQLRKRIREKAGKYARENYTVENCAENWQKHILHA